MYFYLFVVLLTTFGYTRVVSISMKRELISLVIVDNMTISLLYKSYQTILFFYEIIVFTLLLLCRMSVKQWSIIVALLFVSVFSFSHVAVAQTSEQELEELLNLLAESDAPAESEVEVEAESEEESEEHQAAEDILDNLDGEEWSYAAEEAIALESVESDSAMIKLTEVLFNDKPVDRYKIYYSNETLATFQDYDNIQDVTVGIEKVEEDMVFVTLENLEPSTKYYVVIAPVHPTDPTVEPLTMISDEISFTTTQPSIDPETKIFNGVSYTYDQSMVTLTWEPSQLAESAEVHIRHQSESTYTKIGTTDLADGSFNFSVDKAGNFFLKMIALNGEGEPVGREHIQTMKVEEIEAPAEVVVAAPQVGPTTDMIIALLVLSFIIYMVYRFRVARAK